MVYGTVRAVTHGVVNHGTPNSHNKDHITIPKGPRTQKMWFEGSNSIYICIYIYIYMHVYIYILEYLGPKAVFFGSLDP